MILHLSDLHLAPVEKDEIYGDFKDEIVPLTHRENKTEMLKRTLSELSAKLSAEGKKLEAVVLTGDITVRGKEEGYKRLEEILGTLGDQRPDNSRVCVVPGNHDVKWGATEDIEKYELFLKYVRSEKYVTPLLEGIDLKGGATPNFDRHLLLAEDLRWAILPINSSHYCGVNEGISPLTEGQWQGLIDELNKTDKAAGERLQKLRMKDVARISEQQLDGLRKLASAAKAKVGSRGVVLIGALHHQILPVSTREELNAF